MFISYIYYTIPYRNLKCPACYACIHASLFFLSCFHPSYANMHALFAC